MTGTTHAWLIWVFSLANAAACAFTIITTNQFLKKPGYHEANPVSAWLQRVLPHSIWWIPKAVFYSGAIALCFYIGNPAGLILVGLFMITAFDLIGNLSLLSGK